MDFVDPKPARFSEALEFASPHLHLQGKAGCSAALLAYHLSQQLKPKIELETVPPGGGPIVIVTATLEEAVQTVEEICTFHPTARTHLLPTNETIPYDSTRPDRAITLARAAALATLDTGQLDFLITSASGWIRKVIPPAVLSTATISYQLGDSIAPEKLSERLERGGYARVPLVEDPGTFAIRGEIIDIWAPGRPAPLRLELEFDNLRRVQAFDPDTQLTKNSVETRIQSGSFFFPPAREAVATREGSQRARRIMQQLCDDVSLPSSKARALIDDVAGGQMFVGGDGYLPAHAKLSGLFERLSQGSIIIFDDISRIIEAIDDESRNVQLAYDALKDKPAFPPEEHYLLRESLDESIKNQRLVCLHTSIIESSKKRGFQALAHPHSACPHLGTFSQDTLVAAFQAIRKTSGHKSGITPLIEKLTTWKDKGYSVVITARAQTQADRLNTLLNHRDLSPQTSLTSFDEVHQGELFVIVAPLARGLVAPHEKLVLLTEEEIFGRRAHRAKKRTSQAIKNAIDDLRTLTIGDHVVHVEHGVGRYLGLSHQKVASLAVELLIVEYQGGDKLLLPVYRLNQIQKFTGSGEPKLDRLGGQTFARTKSKVRKKVQIMADRLLQLYAQRKAVMRPPLQPPGEDFAAFEASFPHEETPDQAAAINDVISDLQKETVMDRLVCGDVGFGKTEVALRAAFLCAQAGRQVALLCPTTVLAEQHLRTFKSRLEDSGLMTYGMSRFQSKKTQKDVLERAKNGLADIIVGTHRLLSKDVFFKNLGLLIIDEEQRFGVAHKERFKELRKTVDVLTLSATPIPRTLSLAVGGMRDMSIIATPPQSRRSIRTITAQFDEDVICQAIERELSRGGQIFYVYNRVEGIHQRAALLRRLLPNARIGVAHGQVSESSLEKTMLGFVQGEFDILCATSIIESGLDIPRANTIIIDRADLFGLSQLYQLRGRVGRSSSRAYCYLLVPPESRLSSEARSRIMTLERYTELGSGFHVATMDMELRGAGELLGADQSGFMTQVGFEIFAEMLEEATKELQGETYIKDVDPELSIDVEAYIPESYVEDIGVRLSLYKSYALASDEDDIGRLNIELENRFGSPPLEARRFAEVMRLKTTLRHLCALGLSATGAAATLHLRGDTPLDPQRLVELVGQSNGRYRLSPDGRLTRRAPPTAPFIHGLAHAEQMLDELSTFVDPSSKAN